MIKYKKGMIASLNLFFLLFVSRTIIGFTVSSEALKSRYSMDLVYSTFFALLITFLISLPAVICAAKGKSAGNSRGSRSGERSAAGRRDKKDRREGRSSRGGRR